MRILIALCLLLLAGCSEPPRGVIPRPPPDYQAPRNGIWPPPDYKPGPELPGTPPAPAAPR